MVESVNVETNNDIESEKPSTIREGFQRWLIVSGLLFTLLFTYLFFVMKSDEKEKEADEVKPEEVPQQVQQAPIKSKAIDRFQKDIKSPDRTQYGEKVKTSAINQEYAPRNTSFSEKNKRNSDGMLNKTKVTDEVKTPYQKYMEAEQMRAYKSIASEDTIGDGSDFYNTGGNIKKKKKQTKPKRESLESKQLRISDQIEAISNYRKAIERGEVDPSSPPPGLINLLEGKR